MLSTRYLMNRVLPAAFSLLPPKMFSPQAEVMLLAIGWQESRFAHRRQIGGPAVGWWQFERGGGVRGVLEHPDSKDHAAAVCEALCYPPEPAAVYAALADNDVLACAFARLLLYTHPDPLPDLGDADGAWNYYLALWRPGKPRRETWPDAHFFARHLALGAAIPQSQEN